MVNEKVLQYKDPVFSIISVTSSAYKYFQCYFVILVFYANLKQHTNI